MKRIVLSMALVLSLLLTGCSWLDGSYTSVEAHRDHRPVSKSDAVSAANQAELLNALQNLVDTGTQTAAIKVGQYPSDNLERGINVAIRYVVSSYPMGDYAVEDIAYEIGTSAGDPAVAVTISYRRSQAELNQVRKVRDMEAAKTEVKAALKNCDASVVLLVAEYSAVDMVQMVEDYTALYPQVVMEVPKVTETAYGSGKSRVLELDFTYQNSREDLRKMQAQVEPVFNSAVLYVSGDGEQYQKYSQLYGFLMERFDYKVETSLTPAYSLLRHGVGDSKAFAQVYAAMCRSAGLECTTVTGTCRGEPRTWNLIWEGEVYSHVDLLWCNAAGTFQTMKDWEMEDYVWDYSAYPVSEETVPTENNEEK